MLGHAKTTSSPFGELAFYLMHGRNNLDPSQRVDWLLISNLPTQDPHAAAAAMQATANQNTRTEKPAYHLKITWDPEETPSREQMQHVAKTVLRDLGLEDHHALIVAHKDKPHIHMHLVVNRVHPDTRETWKSWQDWRRIEKSLRTLEQELGFRLEPGKLHRVPGVEPPSNDLRSSSGEIHRQRRTGERPFSELLNLHDVRSALTESQSWLDLEEQLALRGYQLNDEPGTLHITDGRRTLRLSAFGRDISDRKLSDRFGETFATHRLQRPEPPPLHHRPSDPDKDLAQARSDLAHSGSIPELERRLAELDHRPLPSLTDIYRDPEKASAELAEYTALHGFREAYLELHNEPEIFGPLKGGRLRPRLRRLALDSAERQARAGLDHELQRRQIREALDRARHYQAASIELDEPPQAKPTRSAQAGLVFEDPEIPRVLNSASSWSQLEHQLADRGLALQPSGRGLRITNGENELKISAFGRRFSRPKLEARFDQSFNEHRRVHPEPPEMGTPPTTEIPEPLQQLIEQSQEFLRDHLGSSELADEFAYNLRELTYLIHLHPRGVSEVLRTSTSWTQLEERLADRGIRLRRSLQGLQLTDNGPRERRHSIAISALDSQSSMPALEKRFDTTFQAHRRSHPEPRLVVDTDLRSRRTRHIDDFRHPGSDLSLETQLQAVTALTTEQKNDAEVVNELAASIRDTLRAGFLETTSDADLEAIFDTQLDRVLQRLDVAELEVEPDSVADQEWIEERLLAAIANMPESDHPDFSSAGSLHQLADEQWMDSRFHTALQELALDVPNQVSRKLVQNIRYSLRELEYLVYLYDRDVPNIIRRASSWHQLEADLAPLGIRVRAALNGLQLTDERDGTSRHAIAISSLDRDSSIKGLERRFGSQWIEHRELNSPPLIARDPELAELAHSDYTQLHDPATGDSLKSLLARVETLVVQEEPDIDEVIELSDALRRTLKDRLLKDRQADSPLMNLVDAHIDRIIQRLDVPDPRVEARLKQRASSRRSRLSALRLLRSATNVLSGPEGLALELSNLARRAARRQLSNTLTTGAHVQALMRALGSITTLAKAPAIASVILAINYAAKVLQSAETLVPPQKVIEPER